MLRCPLPHSCNASVRDRLLRLIGDANAHHDRSRHTDAVRTAVLGCALAWTAGQQRPSPAADRDTAPQHAVPPPERLLHVSFLQTLFLLYDGLAFDGLLTAILPDGSRGMPRLRLSRRMTRAAGKTTFRSVQLAPSTRRRTASVEIALSTPLIGAPVDPAGVFVSGLRCHDRLAVLQRVFEHELIHLLLFCLGEDSRCSRLRFRGLAHTLFGHIESKHQLVLARSAPERAQPLHAAPAVRPGDRVRFTFRGVRHEGIVNRVTRRATVLVPDARGPRYSDGVRYAKFYVPPALLERVESPA